MDFARKQMEHMGWSEGKGLGRQENGIVKPIAPEAQFDTRGLGFSVTDSLQTNNQWWIEAYNAANKGLKPEYKITSIGVIVKANKIKNNKNNKNNNNGKNQVYDNRFVSAGFINNKEKRRKEKIILSESKGLNEKQNETIQYSKKPFEINRIFEENKHIIYHKMSGKMKRIEQQEKEFSLKKNYQQQSVKRKYSNPRDS